MRVTDCSPSDPLLPEHVRVDFRNPSVLLVRFAEVHGAGHFRLAFNDWPTARRELRKLCRLLTGNDQRSPAERLTLEPKSVAPFILTNVSGFFEEGIEFDGGEDDEREVS